MTHYCHECDEFMHADDATDHPALVGADHVVTPA